jgi:hypothetical protein
MRLLPLVLALALAACQPALDPLPADGGQSIVGEGNAEAIEELRRAGADMAKKHPLEFYLYFATQAAADTAAGTLKGRSYNASVDGPVDGEWVVTVARDTMLVEAEITELEQEMVDVAKAGGGAYDNWETELVE